jgi:large subunit ribosomal protein L21
LETDSQEELAMSDYAIIEASGKQFRVVAGETLTTDIMPDVGVGDTITFDRVLLVKDSDNLEVGTPYLEGKTVSAEVETIDRTKKMIVFKYKPKKRYRKKQGHRQHFMVSRVKDIA